MKRRFESSYDEAEALNRKDYVAAKALYEKVIDEIGDKPFAEMDDTELRFFALSKSQIFVCSEFRDLDSAAISIEAFEVFFQRNDSDAFMYEYYIFTLEFTYQLEKSYPVLLELLQRDDMKLLALKYLSSYSYAVEGLQEWEDCITYQRQRVELTTDKREKAKLKRDLEKML